MKEKRYKLESYNDAFSEVHDTESDEWYIRKDLIVDLLNAQDIGNLMDNDEFLDKLNKRIKELTEEREGI